MKQVVIGTAGHIDHGKTALIKALTGIDCDRLKEEKERGITIELGFAYYRFGDDILVGIVDVPGHERFVKHMVAGAWGIDMVLFVVAADESVMPQTREHMDICELLGIRRGIVAITKKDLADEDMIELVKEEVEDLIKGRFLEGAPIIPVSAVTGENIDVLRAEIKQKATDTEERSRSGIFRLPVDRVFTIKGFGTIVTGTCISGSVRVGEEVEIYPTGKKARVRNVQAYHEDVKEAGAGQRVALNLQGIEKQDIERGAIIGTPGTLLLTSRIDASLRYLKLPFKAIIHVAGISMLWRSSKRSIQSSVVSAMAIVNERGFRSVAFPLIGAGTGGFNEDGALKLMLDAFETIDSSASVTIVRHRKG